MGTGERLAAFGAQLGRDAPKHVPTLPGLCGSKAAVRDSDQPYSKEKEEREMLTGGQRIEWRFFECSEFSLSRFGLTDEICFRI